MHISYHYYAKNISSSSVKLVEGRNFAKYDQETLIISKIPKEKHTAGNWINADGSDGGNICQDAEYTIILSITSPKKWVFKTQEFRLYLRVFQEGTGTSGRYFLTDQSKDLFT